MKDLKKVKPIKVGMYLQTDEVKNEKDFRAAMKLVKESDIDLLVFPEFCYIPGLTDTIKHKYNGYYYLDEFDRKFIELKVLDFSKKIGKAVIVSMIDREKVIFSVFANPRTGDISHYVKYTATEYSILEWMTKDANVDDKVDFFNVSKSNFKPFNLNGNMIGMTICYDLQLPLFSRLLSLNGANILINSTGGDVKFHKWYRANKTRAIENHCYNLVTMGGSNEVRGSKCCTLGFNPEGGEMKFYNLDTGLMDEERTGVINVYTIDYKNVYPTEDRYLDDDCRVLKESNCMLDIPVNNMPEIIKKSEKLDDCLYVFKKGNKNIVILDLFEKDIYNPEKELFDFYNQSLDKYKNKLYIIYSHFDNLKVKEYETLLVSVLRQRSVENKAAVVFETSTYNKCFIPTSRHEVQSVKAVDGVFRVDLSGCTGPEGIWIDGTNLISDWRSGYVALANDLIKKVNK